MRLTRRALLGAAAGSAAAAAAATAVVADRRGASGGSGSLFTDCGPDGSAPNVATGVLASGKFRSVARAGRTVGWTVAYPPGRAGTGLPVCLVLHGRGADHAAAFQQLQMHKYLADAVRRGVPPFALASIDGGAAYWHPRVNGDDPQAMLLQEFLPLLARRGLLTNRFGLIGWSMGGYGALLLAERLGAIRVAGVAAASPALWTSAGDLRGGVGSGERGRTGRRGCRA